MNDGTVLAFCAECGGSIDLDMPYRKREGDSFVHEECARPVCIVSTCDAPLGRFRSSGTVRDSVCDRHQGRYAPALLKAAEDTFDYALQLVTGQIVYFDHCYLYEDWIHVENYGDKNGSDFRRPHGTVEAEDPIFPIPGKRGLDVRLEHIVWCADAPWGS